MARPLIVPLPPGLELHGGCSLRVAALDPATGELMPGVFVANVTFEVAMTGGDASELSTGEWLLVTGPQG